MYVDVKLGANRTVNIAIADGDDPSTVAQQFCKIYSLDSSACSILTQVVYDNMVANGITMQLPQQKQQHQEVYAQSESSDQVFDEANNAGIQSSNTDSWRPSEGLVDTLQLRKPARRKTLGRRSDELQSESEDSIRAQFAGQDGDGGGQSQDYDDTNEARFEGREEWQPDVDVQDDDEVDC